MDVTSWDSNPVPVQSPSQPNHRGAPWEPDGTGSPFPEPPPPPAPATDQWVYVDPSAYSDPFTHEPVYTSGPQTGPAAAAAPMGTIPAVSPPAGRGVSTSDPLEGFGILLPPPPPPPLVPTSPAGSPADPLLTSSYEPEKGELKIKERRSWKTWQLLTAVVLAAVLGMWFNGNAGSASGTSNSASGGGYKLPPASGSSSATVPVSGGASTATTNPSGGVTPTTGAGGSTSTTSASGASGSTPATGAATVGPATVLIPETQQTGNWTSPAFTIAGGTWNIGWAFQCAPAPTGGPSFQIFVVNSGAAPGSTPAVTSTAASGQSVSPETTAGSQQVVVQTTAACRWAMKVTGSSS